MSQTLDFMQKRIDARLGDKTPKQKVNDDTPVDFITRFQMISEENPEKVDKQDIETSAINNFFAGSDTTSISLNSVIYNLCNHPDVLSRLRDEIVGAMQRGEIVEPITYKQAQQLPFLQAVIKESLRVHPAGGLAMGRVVPQGGATIAGQYFPAGVGPPGLKLNIKDSFLQIPGRRGHQCLGCTCKSGRLWTGCRHIPPREVVGGTGACQASRSIFPFGECPLCPCIPSPLAILTVARRMISSEQAPEVVWVKISRYWKYPSWFQLLYTTMTSCLSTQAAV